MMIAANTQPREAPLKRSVDRTPTLTTELETLDGTTSVVSELSMASVAAPAKSKETQDRVKVALRMRPTEQSQESNWEIDSNTITATQGRIKSYQFDAIFNELSQTQEIYNNFCRSVVAATHVGRNGTIFAYGNTGSGKTYTMQGQGQAGIIQLAAYDVFAFIENNKDYECTVKVKYFEVYNEQIRDLIGKVKPGRNGKAGALPILDLTTNNGVRVNGTEVVVSKVADIEQLLEKGRRNRTVAATDFNKASSRSHAIFQMKIEMREKDSTKVRKSVLNLVDLAGSEKNYGRKGSTKKLEGGKINQSLLSLSKVINTLSLPEKRRPKYIGFRESKLTRILEPSLSGKACTAILCCASQASHFVEETRSTLKFAASARLVACNAPVNQTIDTSALVLKLQSELEATRQALVQLQQHITSEATATDESVIGASVISDDQTTDSYTTQLSGKNDSDDSVDDASQATPSTSDDNSPSTDADDQSHLQSMDEMDDAKSLESDELNDSAETFEQIQLMQESAESLNDSSDFLQGSGFFREAIIETTENDETSVSYMIEIVDDEDPVTNASVAVAPVGEVVVGVEEEIIVSAKLRMELAEAVDQNAKLQAKLDSANRLVDTLFQELKEARAFNEEALDRNELMEETIIAMKRANAAVETENNALRSQQALLKYAIYVALLFCWTGYAEYFIAAVMFLWLSLETLGFDE